MGIGNYTEQDIKECARAFTGWTLGNAEYMAVRASKDSIWPYGRIAWHFEYRDATTTTVKRPSWARPAGSMARRSSPSSRARRLQRASSAHGCFSSSRPTRSMPRANRTIREMMQSYFDSGYEIRAVLRTLFHSNYFTSEQARYARVKGPVELVVGAIRLAGSYQTPTLGAHQLAYQTFYMGQGLLQPPSVEGWHEGWSGLTAAHSSSGLTSLPRNSAMYRTQACGPSSTGWPLSMVAR